LLWMDDYFFLSFSLVLSGNPGVGERVRGGGSAELQISGVLLVLFANPRTVARRCTTLLQQAFCPVDQF
jgi:hypothetical protein